MLSYYGIRLFLEDRSTAASFQMPLLGRTVAMFGGSLANFASNNKLPSTVVHTYASKQWAHCIGT